MHIERIHIDGFGRFAQQDFASLDSRLAVIVGPNEAGKSTLLAFVYAMLYGFKTNGDLAAIPPLAGGRHGGWLQVGDGQGGATTIARYSGPRGGSLTVTLPDGGPGNAGHLARLLGDVPAELFRNLFGFGLDQLQSLDGPMAAEHIYGATMGVSNLSQAMTAFKKQADALFLPTGRQQPVGQKFDKLARVQQALDAALLEAGRYPQVQSRRAEIERELAGVAAETQAALEDQRRSARLLEGWPLGVRLMALRERLSQAPVVPRFPEDGLARLDQAEAALRTARGEFEAAEREAQQAHAAAEAPAPDAALLAQREALRRLRAGRAGFERAAAALPDLRAEISSATARLQSDVQQFGDGWDLHRILAVDLSLPQRDALRSHRDQLAQTRQELREAAAQAISREADWATAQAEAQRSVTRVPEQPAFDREWLAARRSALAAARAQYSEAEARRRTLETEQRNLAGLEASPVPAPDASPAPMDTPPPADRAVLTARRSALSRVRTEMAVLATRRLNLEEESRLLATLEDPAAPSPAGPAPLGPTWLPFALAAAGALLVVVGVVGDRLPAAGAGVVLVVIAAALWQRGAAGRGAGAPQRVEDQKARVAAAAEAAGQAAVAFAQTAQALGLPDGADVSTLDDVEASIDREALALQSWEQGQRDRAQAGEGAAQRRQERMNEQRERVAVAMATAEREVLRLRAVVQAAGLPPNADAATFTTAEAALEAGRTALERWEQAVQDRARLEAQAQRLQGLQDQADTAHLAAGLAAESAAGAWRSWLAAQGLPQGLSPEGALELINTVEAVRRSAGEIDATRERLAGAEQEVAQFRAALMELTEAIGEGFPAGDLSAVGMYVDRLIERYDEALLAHERRQHLQEAATVARSQWERRRDALRSERTNLEALLALADAPDPEAFRERGRQYAERQALERDQAECVERLQALAGGGEAIAALLDALATADPDALRDRVEQRQGMVQALADQRDALRREQGKLDAEAAALERGGGAAALRAERDLTLEGLRGDAEQWATVTLAQALLRRALRRFEEERQPSVVRAAQEFYSNIVGRPGLRLYVPVGEGGLEVVEAEGRRTPEQLSRGAREQLYLSLRFGLIRELGQRSERLPVLVDDVLVNFDPERARRSAEAFVQLSETNQVLVFTCHPATADLFKSVSPNAQIIELAPVGR